MKFIERFSALTRCRSLTNWRDQIFKLGCDLGYEQTRLAIFPDPRVSIEAEHAFQQSNYSSDWLNKYTAEKLHYIDPIFSHCVKKSTPLIWSPEIFSSRKQKEMYEEACGYGVKSGVTLPIHGAKGELGVVCFVSDVAPNANFHRDANHHLPELSCFRDYILESSLRFMKSPHQTENRILLTPRELECLKWSAAGKSARDIGQLLHCSEAAVNFHFGNIFRKFGTSTRQQAIIKAINLGFIHPA